MHVLEGEPVRSWGNRIESSTCIKTLWIDCIELFQSHRNWWNGRNPLNESFLGACPRRQGLVNLSGDTDTGRCVCHAWRRCTRLPWQPRRAYMEQKLMWRDGSWKGKLQWPSDGQIEDWQPLNTSCVGYPILSDVIRFYGMFWVAVSATHCKWILHSNQAGPRSPSVVHVSSWLTNPSCLIPGSGCTPQGRIVRVQEVEVKLIRPQRRGRCTLFVWLRTSCVKLANSNSLMVYW